jgi:hypothetical protein
MDHMLSRVEERQKKKKDTLTKKEILISDVTYSPFAPSSVESLSQSSCYTLYVMHAHL